MSDHLDLLEYRRLVAGFYTRVRASEASEETWLRWRTQRDDLFAVHPQSPIEDRGSFQGLAYFDYDPRWRVAARFVGGPSDLTSVAHSGSGSTSFEKIGRLEFELEGQALTLAVLWLKAYGGGVFIPFRDATSGSTTYGGGRYLIDTVKGADLGHSSDGLILDFNYAYHPSCVHSSRWSCPLSPPENKLSISVTAGERLSADHT